MQGLSTRCGLLRCLLIFSFLVVQPAAGASELFLGLEGGGVFLSKNTVQIPNDASGTRFDMQALLGEGPLGYYRVELKWRINPNNLLRATYAPYDVSESGFLTKPVNFEGATFSPQQPVNAVYRFNTTRLTYRYTFHRLNWHFGVGAALLVRDAEISLEQNGTSRTNLDLGLVPLLHANIKRELNPEAYLELDALGAAAPQGRAFDVSLTVNRPLGEEWLVSAGYRVLEGGVDIDELYNFALLQYVVVGLRYQL